jgi:hypothetical protein
VRIKGKVGCLKQLHIADFITFHFSDTALNGTCKGKRAPHGRGRSTQQKRRNPVTVTLAGVPESAASPLAGSAGAGMPFRSLWLGPYPSTAHGVAGERL